MDDVQRAVHARRGAPGSEKVHRGRTATADRLRGDEGPREDDPAAERHSYPRSPRPADRTIHRHEQAGRSGQVAGRAGEVFGSRSDLTSEEMTRAVWTTGQEKQQES